MGDGADGTIGRKRDPWFGIDRDAALRAATIVVAAAATALVLRLLYHLVFPWILSFNLTFPPGILTPWIEQWTAERDGIEIYAVYSLVFAIIGLTALVVFGLRLLKRRWLQGLLLLVLTAAALGHVASLRFLPPSDGSSNLWATATFAVALGLLVGFRRWIPERLGLLLAVLILVPACFIITSRIAPSNYAYMFAPAQKMLEGTPVQEIYFQYDFLISALAALWFKAGLAPNDFQFVGALANFATILALFLMARRLFETKALAYLLLASIIIFRILSAPWDPVYVFQITPLRLDLWVIPFLIIYFRGPSSLFVPLVCGILIVVHGAFGVVYSLGYLQLILTLAVFETIGPNWRNKLRQWIKAGAILRVLATGLYWAGCYLLAKYLFGQSTEATSLYQKIGIGFIPLSFQSMYWIMPILLSSLCISLFLLRRNVSATYLALGLSLGYFFAGNSIYFFGRSHELNLFSISISMFFVVFFAFDALSRSISTSAAESDNNRRGMVALVLGALVLVVIVQACGDKIGSNLAAKWQGVVSLRLSPADAFAEVQPSVDNTLAAIEDRLGPNAQVQFLIIDETREFLFYQGKYENKTFFYPFAASVFVADMVQNARALLAEGRYLLLDEKAMATAIAGGLLREEFGYESVIGDYTLVGREPPADVGR